MSGRRLAVECRRATDEIIRAQRQRDFDSAARRHRHSGARARQTRRADCDVDRPLGELG